MGIEPALRFFLRYLEHSGAAVVEAEDEALVELPPALQKDLGLPSELAVTSSPEVAAEGEAQLVIPGHPLLDAAASRILSEGDAGHRFLAWPRRALPTAEALLAGLRDYHPIEHGRVDLQGEPIRIHVPVLRFGALATYSGEDRFLERLEAFVDAWTALPLSLAVARRIALLPEAQPAEPVPVLAPRIADALREGLGELHRCAGARAAEIQAGDQGAMAAERARAEAYYDAQLAQIAKRREGALPDRQKLYDAQRTATMEERQRRLREIADKFEVQSEVHPFRLHLLLAPALYLPVEVRRGERRYPFALHYLLEANSFLPVRCPHCHRAAPLVAGREHLGCAGCLPPGKAVPSGVSPLQVPASRSSGAQGPPRSSEIASPLDRRSSGVQGAPSRGAGSRPDDGSAAQRSVAGPILPPARAEPPPADPAQLDLFADHASPAPSGATPPRSRPPASLRDVADAPPPAIAPDGQVPPGPGLAELTEQFLAEVLRGRLPTVPIERHSPLDVLLRLFGWQGAFVAIDMDYPLAPLRRYRMTVDREVRSSVLNGNIRAQGATVRFSTLAGGGPGGLSLRELLPVWADSEYSLIPLARSGQVRALAYGPPPGVTVPDMGRVEWTLFFEGGARFHLAILLRAMSVWRRVRRRLDAVAPEVASSALVEFVLDAANLRAPDRLVSRTFHADPHKCRALRSRIASLLAPESKGR